jgi:hypothetical protein
LQGAITSRAFFDSFEPETHREGETVVRYIEAYASRSCRRVLIETVVIESGRSRRFFIEMHDKEDGVGIRLEPLTDPEKTDAVKWSLACVAKRMLTLDPETRIARHNLGELL